MTIPVEATHTATPPASTRDMDRARLRATVTIAARVLPTHYPLPTFIAVNPLDGLRRSSFAEAADRAGELYGARGTLTEQAYRRHYAQGRITAEDLDLVLTRRYPKAANQPPLPLGWQAVDALSLLRADLVHGREAPDPARVFRTASEQASPATADRVASLTSRWCAAFLTSDTTSWSMPGRENGFYPAWRALAHRDPTLSRAVRGALRSLPDRADDAALDALDALGVTEQAHRDYVTAHLTEQPGWAAHIRWRTEHSAGARIDLLDYLAVRLTYEALLLADQPRPPLPVTTLFPGSGVTVPGLVHRAADVCAALEVERPSDAELTAVARLLTSLPAKDRVQVWLEAFEHHYRDALLDTLLDPTPASMAAPRPPAQLVCCIDTRSEGLRRHLEAIGAYETLGFAGFFAAAVRYTDVDEGGARDLCPVLIQPVFAAAEIPAPDLGATAARRREGRQAIIGADDGFHRAKDDALSPFALAEATGWVSGPVSAARTAFPRSSAAVARLVRRWAVPQVDTTIDIDEGFSVNDRVLYARVALSTMGLTRNFARLVVFCGHGSATTNNPYQASLDCGACGGQRGGPAARVAVAILNDSSVRNGLAEHDIHIPTDTWFVAAEHDTATDTVVVLDDHLVPADHRGELERLRLDLAAAGQALTAERCAMLPGASARTQQSLARAGRHARTRSADWAQVYPEWGLVGNASFIIGPRSHTRGIDLHRRAFLHSYRHEDDPAGAALETILTAPLIVAQWINAQYYFSAVSPQTFGSGTKTIHNVLGGVGVLAGHAGDLQLGLPWQSVAYGEDLVHEAMRLLTVIYAPIARIDEIVDRNTILQELLNGDWFTFVARENPTEPWQERTRTGWQPWTTPTQQLQRSLT